MRLFESQLCIKRTLTLPNSRTDKENLAQVEDDLNTTEDGKASEEAEGASNDSKLILQAVLDISFNLVVSRRVKVDVKDVQLSILLFSALKHI